MNHIKIIPVRYGESRKEHEFVDRYRYSIRSGRSGKQDTLSSITFLTEIEPINIVYHKVHRSAYQLVVRVTLGRCRSSPSSEECLLPSAS